MIRRLGSGFLGVMLAAAALGALASPASSTPAMAQPKERKGKPLTERERWNAEVEARKAAKKERKP
jgi:hypothetical protein